MGLYKRLTALALIAAMSASMCACSASGGATGDSGASDASIAAESTTAGQSETTAEATGAIEPEVTESETEATEATDTSTSMPSVTETSQAAEKPVIKVSDAYKKKFKYEGYKMVFKYPKISISTVSTKSVNDKIKKDMKHYKNDGVTESDYSYYIGKDIVSICLWHEGGDGDTFDVHAYNVSIATGKLVDDKEVLKESGVSEKKFWSLVKSTYKKFGAGFSGSPRVKECYKKNVKKATFKYVTPYLNKKGQLCFIGFVYYDGGAGEGYRNFNTKTKKVVKNW